MADRHDAYAALRIPYVRAFALGRITSSMGAGFLSVAVGWELYERTNDPWALGLVGLAQIAPAMVLIVPAGNLADRYPRRRIGFLSHALLFLVGLAMAAVSWLEAPTALVYLLLVLAGIGRAFSGPATGTLLAQLLEPRQFANAVAWLISSGHFASVAGPALGGLLIAATGGATSSYVVAALGHLSFMLALRTVPHVPPTAGAAQRGIGDVFAGIWFIRRSQVFLAAITLDLFAVLLGGAVALLPVFARDVLAAGPLGLGLLRAAPSAGAFLSALATTRLPPFPRPGLVLLLMVAGFGATTLAFGLSRSLPLSMLCLFLAGAFDSVSMVIRHTLQQVITPDRLRGRVSAVGSLFTGLSNEMGSFRAGTAAALLGPIVAVVSGGIGTLVVVLIVALTCPALARIGPLHTLQPTEPDAIAPRPSRQPASL
jgi:MFS family permease